LQPLAARIGFFGLRSSLWGESNRANRPVLLHKRITDMVVRNYRGQRREGISEKKKKGWATSNFRH